MSEENTGGEYTADGVLAGCYVNQRLPKCLTHIRKGHGDSLCKRISADKFAGEGLPPERGTCQRCVKRWQKETGKKP